MPSTKIASKKRAPSASWLDIVWKAVHQLSVIHTGRDHFHYYQDICRYIETHWERLAQGKDRTSTWTNTVSSTITTHKRIFKPGPDQGFWGLRQHPEDDTPLEILEKLRSELQVDIPLPSFDAGLTSQQSRRKRKTGWGDSKSKKRRVTKKPASPNARQVVDEWIESDSEVDLSGSVTDERSETLAPQQLPLLPPIFPLREEEEEFVDIEGVSEEELLTPAPLSPALEYVPSWDSIGESQSSHEDFLAPSFTVESLPSEDWFQSLFVQ